MDLYKCPDCGGEAYDLDCSDCDGLGEVDNVHGEPIACSICGGDAVIYGEFECVECGLIYNEDDLYSEEKE